MQILRGAGDFDLVVIQAAEAVGDGRHAFREHGSVRYDERIGFQAFAIFLHEIPKADAADFFFPSIITFTLSGIFP